ncbi:MAG: glycosyltransferase [Actinobacteria bacterium]|nr:glycosyltransferase [Actinomycetota bacterium]MCL6104503.1 glycosyltransferase [Actinomycetota bacterium]
MHTSPLSQPGSGDGGGMNVYVHQLATALARLGNECDVYTRALTRDYPSSVLVEPGFRLHYVRGGPLALIPKESLPELAEEFASNVAEMMDMRLSYDAIHANYWLSGIAAHILKHEFNIPLISTFHTLARVKAIADPDEDPIFLAKRALAETEIIQCSDAMLACSATEEAQLRELYKADPSRIHTVPPAVDHAFFGPGMPSQARRALGINADPLLLFVGRIQSLKGPDIAVEVLADIRKTFPNAVLAIVGGPSGKSGEHQLTQLKAQSQRLGVCDAVYFVEPQPHERLSTYYRAADVCLVPSKTESFGLVALEAAACGTPVVASAVGGLQSLIDHKITGFLVDNFDKDAFSAYTRMLLTNTELSDGISRHAQARAKKYTWLDSAKRLQNLCSYLVVKQPVACE